MRKSGPEVLKLFSCSTQLSMEFQLLIKIKMLKNIDILGFFKLLDNVFHLLNYELSPMYNWYVHAADPKIYIPKFCNLWTP